MDTPSKSLPGVGSLLSEAWKLFTSTWNTSVKTSALLLISPVITLVLDLLIPNRTPYVLLLIAVAIVEGVIFVWATIRLMLTMLNLEAGKPVMAPNEESQKAMNLLLPFCWIGFLVGLVTLGATLLLVLPGIYFNTALAFSALLLIDQGKRGTQALAASRALVKGRWWDTFIDMFVAGIVFGLPIAILSNVAAGIVLYFARTNATYAVDATSLVSYIVIAATMPLIMGFQIKLYRALQRSR